MKRRNAKQTARPSARNKNASLAAGMLLLSSCSFSPVTNVSSAASQPQVEPRIAQYRAALAGQDGDFTVTSAQTILNTYTTLGVALVKGDSILTVVDSTVLTGPTGMPLKQNDLILIYQAQGATIDTSDDVKKYGTIQALNGTGRFELVNVVGVAGNRITISGSCKGVQNNYSLPGRTQVIRVPQFNNLTINPGASVVARTWDGKVGGIVAMHVLHDTKLGGTIDVTARGFSGGKVDPNANPALLTKVTTAVTKDETLGAAKGESVAGSQADYMASAGHIGRGAPANGGGGGNAFKTGGGGGAGGGDQSLWTGQGVMDKLVTGGAMAWALDQAYKDNASTFTTSTGGGRGGYAFSRPMALAPDPTIDPPGDPKWGVYGRYDVGGLGGHPLQPIPGFELFLGGGGGAGDQADASAGIGGSGGGVVILMSNTVTVPPGGTGLIKATGGGGQDTGNGYNDGAGGGGGGGSIFVLSGKALDKSVVLAADGGAAGSQRNAPSDPQEAEGPGGGGGGGVIVYMAGGSPTTSVRGQTGGTTIATTMTKFPSNGASNGFDGLVIQAPRQPIVGGMPGSYPVCLAADLQVTVVPPTGMVQPGSKATYDVTVKNIGENPALGADISTQLPPGTDPNQVTWTCMPVGAGVACPAPMGTGSLPPQADLPPGTTLDFNVSLPVPSVSPTPTLDLSVSAYPPPGYTDPDTTNNNAIGKAPITGVVVKQPQSDLEITLTKNPPSPNPGDEVTVTANAKNNGPDIAGQPVAIFSIPPGSTVTQAPPLNDPSSQWNCPSNGTTYTCTLKMDLPPGQTAPPLVAKFKIPVDTSPLPTGTPQVVATVGSPTSADPNPTNNTALIDVGPIKPAPSADLALTVNKSPVTNGAGMETAFTLQPQNLGPDRAPNPYLVFTVPPGSAFTQEPTGAGWSCLRSGFTITCLMPQLSPNAPVQPVAIRIVAPPAVAPSNNPGSVVGVIGSSKVRDPNPLNNTDSKSVGAVTTPTGSDLAIRITVDKPNPMPGDEVTYTGTASSGGPDPVANPEVVINLPPGAIVTTPAQGDGWSCTQTGSTAICTRNTIGQGDAPPITVKITIPDSGLPSGETGTPTTTGVIGAPNNDDPNPSNNTTAVDTRPTAPVTRADLALTIIKTPPMGATGMEVTYTLQAANKGPATVKYPSVTFSVPAGSTITQPAQGQGWGCLQSSYSFTCYLNADFPVGDAPPITVKLNTPASADPSKSPGTVAGVVSAPANNDPNLLNNVASVSVLNTPGTGSDLMITITSSPSGPKPGDVVTFQGNAANKGPASVQDPVVTINLPPDAEVVEEPHGDGWSCSRAASSVLCMRQSVPQGDAPPIIVKIRLPEYGYVTPVATATVSAANNNDPVLSNNVAQSDLYRLVGGGIGCRLGVGSPQDASGLALMGAGLAIALGLRRRRSLRAA